MARKNDDTQLSFLKNTNKKKRKRDDCLLLQM